MKSLDRNDIDALDMYIRTSDRITVAVHIHPDGDAIGSAVAMLGYLSGLGRDAAVVLPDPHPSALGFLIEQAGKKVYTYSEAKEETEDRLLSSDLVICQDFNSFSRTGDLENVLRSAAGKKVLIDHHLDPDTESFDLCFSETDVSSTAELLYYILMEMPGISHDARKLPAISATALMTGMTTDTNNFANSVFPTTLDMASALLDAGVDRDLIIDKVFNSYKETRIRLMGYLLDRCLTITGDGVAYMILGRKTIMKFGIQDGDTEGFVNIPLAISNVRMSIFLKQDKDRFRVSIRSKKGTSANRCAREYFNGGGHELASGGKLMIPDDVKGIKDAAAYIEKVTHIFFSR